MSCPCNNCKYQSTLICQTNLCLQQHSSYHYPSNNQPYYPCDNQPYYYNNQPYDEQPCGSRHCSECHQDGRIKNKHHKDKSNRHCDSESERESNDYSECRQDELIKNKHHKNKSNRHCDSESERESNDYSEHKHHKDRHDKNKSNKHCSACDSQSEQESSDVSENKRKRCDKCYRHNCDCVEYYPYIRTRCGCIAAMLTKTASVSHYTGVGQVITYYYTITNIGTEMICFPIQICDDKLGGQIIPCSNIPPCMSQTYSRTYTISPSDLDQTVITNTAIAYIKVKRNKWICTQPSSATIIRG